MLTEKNKLTHKKRSNSAANNTVAAIADSNKTS